MLRKGVLFSLLFFTSLILKAQLDDGRLAPFWEVTDLDGNNWSLTQFLEQDKHVILDFSATWCGICWNYHQTDILDELNLEFGPSGSDELQVFMFEASWNTNDACCYGQSGCNYISQGNFTNVSYPVVNLEDEELDILDAYQISYFPTIFIINGEHQTIWQLGQASYSSWETMIVESFSLEVDIELTPGTCDIGTLNAQATGGAGDLTYEWSSGESETTIIGESGYYDLTVTDENGYYVVVQDILLENDPEEFIVDDVDIEDVSCAGSSDGLIELDITSSSSITFSWDNGESGPEIDGLEAGVYTVTVTNPDNGCEAFFDYVVEEPDTLVLDVVSTPSSCGLTNGVIELLPSGGVGQYQFDLGLGYSTDPVLTELDSGSYTITVIDGNNCVSMAEAQVDIIPIPQILISEDSIITCMDTSIQLVAHSMVADSFQFVWTDLFGDTLSIGDSLEVHQAGTYFLASVYNDAGCQTLDSTTIAEDIQPPLINITGISDIGCGVDSVVISFDSADDGSVSSYWEYELDGDNEIVFGDSVIVTLPGMYTLHVEHTETGCTTMTSFEVSETPDAPTSFFDYTIILDQVLIEPNAVGDVDSEQWTIDGQLISFPEDSIIVFTQNGEYLICYTVVNECAEDQYCQTIEINGISGIETILDSQIELVSLDGCIEISNQGTPLNDVQLTLYSINGVAVWHERLDILKGTNRVMPSGLTTGVYIVSLKFQNAEYSNRLFLKR